MAADERDLLAALSRELTAGDEKGSAAGSEDRHGREDSLWGTLQPPQAPAPITGRDERDAAETIENHIG